MDENQQPANGVITPESPAFAQPAGQAMDVTAPKTQDTIAETSYGQNSMGGGYAPDSSANMTASTPAPAELAAVPVVEAPSADNAQINPEAHQPASASHKAGKGGAPVLAIVFAVIVAAALAGLVIYTYFKGKNSDTVKRSSSSSQTVVSKPQASPSDIDATNQEIDNSLQSTNDNKDFAATELSDSALGL
jgi:hypothetical protein